MDDLSAPALKGSFWVLVLYDVSEQIDLEELRKIVGAEPAQPQPSFKHPTPDYVRFERPPVIEYPDPIVLETGEQFQCRIKYYDYGVASVELVMPFEGNWDELVHFSSRWISAPEIDRRASDLLRAHIKRVEPAFEQPYSSSSWLSEDYYIIQLREVCDPHGQPMTGPGMLSARGAQIAQIVRGESLPLSEAERNEVLQSSMSYYPSDLMVVGWVSALIYDTPQGAAPTIQLLEYGNTQLLEFRHYDDVLTRVLQNVYKVLERKGGVFRRWRLAGEAERLNTILLDVRELTERTDNAIKFLSDMFYARAYRMAANKVGVTDYRNLVEEKIRTASELYQFMTNEFHQARAFVLEALVVAILVIELVRVFR
jgi:hypothetical protein